MSGAIGTTYIDVSKDGLHSRVKNINNVCLTDVKFKMDITNEDMYGKLYIKNSDMFIKILKTFSGTVVVKRVDDYVINITSEDNSRTVDVIMASELIVDNIIERDLPVIPTVRTITMEKKFLANSLSDITLLKMGELSIQATDNKLKFTIGAEKESDVLTNIMTVSQGDPVNVSIGSYLKELHDSLDATSNITMSIGTNIPVVFKEVTEDFEYTCIIAPIVTN